MMKRHLKLFLLSALLVLAATVQYAQTVSMVRVTSNPDGPWLYVDGSLYYHAMAAFWPVGSQHTLWAPSGEGYAYNIDQTIQWQFQGWQSSGGVLPGNPVQVIASPSANLYTAVYNAQYRFTLQFQCN